MGTRGFKIKSLKQFVELADQVTSPKFIDTTHSIAFFYVKKRIEYEPLSKQETELIIKHGFIEGQELEVLELW